jgi:hypothetical protein
MKNSQLFLMKLKKNILICVSRVYEPNLENWQRTFLFHSVYTY